MKDADMDIMVGASAENIMMVEGEMKEVSEQDMIGALKAAMAAIKPMCELQTELSKELGTDVKREYCHEVNDEDLRQQMNTELYPKAYDVTKQADGSVVLRMGNTVLLATVCAAKDAVPGTVSCLCR